MIRLLSALVLLTLVGAAPLHANEQSEALSARALIEIDAGRTTAALALLDQAVAADPSDADARYLRGTLRGQAGDFAGASDDLRAALALRPEFHRAGLELGVALVEQGRFEEAVPVLVQAQRQPDLDARASFFLGLAQLRLDRLDEASANFARARGGDPALVTSVEYYEGVIAFRRDDFDSAEARFTAVETAKPTSAMGREAVQYLNLIRRARRAAYSVYGTVALEYDSNVTLGPETTNVAGGAAVTGQGDGRVVLNAGGRYVPYRRGPFSLTLGYEFFQSLQFHLTDFNLQDHRPAVQLQLDFDWVSVGLLGRYDYYLIADLDSFMQEATAFPWVTLREPGIGQTEFYARIQWRDYTDYQAPAPSALGPFEVLDGWYNFAGVRQVIDLGAPGRRLWFGYELGFNDLDSDPVGCEGLECPGAFEYGAQQVEVALRWPLPYAVVGEAGYRFEFQGYGPESAPASPPFDKQRSDYDHRVLVSFERPLRELSEHLFVVASWFGTWNDSNKVLFEYERQIGSIAAEVRF